MSWRRQSSKNTKEKLYFQTSPCSSSPPSLISLKNSGISLGWWLPGFGHRFRSIWVKIHTNIAKIRPICSICIAILSAIAFSTSFPMVFTPFCTYIVQCPVSSPPSAPTSEMHQYREDSFRTRSMCSILSTICSHPKWISTDIGKIHPICLICIAFLSAIAFSTSFPMVLASPPSTPTSETPIVVGPHNEHHRSMCSILSTVGSHFRNDDCGVLRSTFASLPS
jgi:hypothetical protein